MIIALAALSLAITFAINRRFPPEGKLHRLADGRRLHIAQYAPTERSAAADVVLIHGASATLGDQLLALCGTLARRYRVLAIDRPGQGWSDRLGRADASPSRQAKLIASGLKAAGVEEAIIVGHSFGAAVAAALALEEPSFVRGLVFVAPASHPWPGGVDWRYRLAATPVIGHLFTALIVPIAGSLGLEAGVTAVFAPEIPPPDYARRSGAARAVTPGRFRANGEDVASLKAHLAAQSKRYHEITAPCVIITGNQDSVVWPSIHSQGLARDIAGARIVTLAGAGHMPHHSHPQEVLAAIDGMLSSRVAGEASNLWGSARWRAIKRPDT